LRGGFDEWKKLGFPLDPLKISDLPLDSAQTV
jgi:hypothetical protein